MTSKTNKTRITNAPDSTAKPAMTSKTNKLPLKTPQASPKSSQHPKPPPKGSSYTKPPPKVPCSLTKDRLLFIFPDQGHRLFIFLDAS